MNIRLINLAIILQVLLSAVNQYFILSWAVRFTKATSSFEIKLINSCPNTLCPSAKHQEVLVIFVLVLLANQAPSDFYRYGNAADFIFSSLYPRVELEETLFWTLSQSWELPAENRRAVLPRMRGEGRRGVTPCF